MSFSKEILNDLGWFDGMRKETELREPVTGIFEIEANTIELRERLRKGQRVILLVSGVSGGGKDSLVKALVGEDQDSSKFIRVKTCTTREPREEEKIEDPYVRLSVEDFLQKQERGEFFEWDGPYAEAWYGASREVVRSFLETGKTCLFVITPDGARNYLRIQNEGEEIFEDAALIYLFLLPENWRQLGRRLLEREVYSKDWTGQDPHEKKKARQTVRKRWAQNAKDLENMDKAHFVVVNESGNIERVAESIKGLIGELETL